MLSLTHRILLTAILAVAAASAADLPPMGDPILLFDGKNLDNFDIYVRDRPLNEDPNKIFTIQKGMVRSSGEEYGYIVTKEEYGDYYLRMEFKWGDETWEPRKEKARDSGILYHVHGENKIWPSSIEYQFIEGGTGDILVVNGPSMTVTCSPSEYVTFGLGFALPVVTALCTPVMSRSGTGVGCCPPRKPVIFGVPFTR